MYKKQKSISEYKVGESFSDVFVVRFTKDLRKTKTGKFFFEIKIQDANGDAMLKYWGSDNEEKVRQTYDSLKEDDVIFVDGSVSEFNNNIDFSVNEGKLKVLSVGEYDPSDFVLCSKKDKDEMFDELNTIMSSVQNPELKQVLDSFFGDKDFVEKFKVAPGAMYVHHGWVSGLLEHTLSVTKICLHLAEEQVDLNKDLLITGAILHDIGKMLELDVTTQIKVNDKGNLVGHMILGVQELVKRLDKLSISDEIQNKLLHIMISHHGKVEYGCPKPPMIPEAVIIAKADDLDATAVAMIDARKNANTNDSFVNTKHLGIVYLK